MKKLSIDDMMAVSGGCPNNPRCPDWPPRQRPPLRPLPSINPLIDYVDPVNEDLYDSLLGPGED